MHGRSFITKTLPMIKIESIDGQPFEDGIHVIQEIVEKRADLTLFEDDVLDQMIQYTAGSYRKLANVYECCGKYDEAERLYKKVLHIYLNTLGKVHPKTELVRHELQGLHKGDVS